jgi:hypothetical protein
MSKKRQNLPNFGGSGLILCKKSIKTGEMTRVWDFSDADLEIPMQSALNFPGFMLFTKGKFYKYMKLSKTGKFLVKTDSNTWFPFNLHFFSRYFRIFT